MVCLGESMGASQPALRTNCDHLLWRFSHVLCSLLFVVYQWLIPACIESPSCWCSKFYVNCHPCVVWPSFTVILILCTWMSSGCKFAARAGNGANTASRSTFTSASNAPPTASSTTAAATKNGGVWFSRNPSAGLHAAPSGRSLPPVTHGGSVNGHAWGLWQWR